MTQTTRPRAIMSEALWPAFVKAGLFPDDGSVRRVVIDVQAGHAVVMYVEMWGDDRLLDVIPTLEGIEVRGVSAANAPGDADDQEFDQAVDAVSDLIRERAAEVRGYSEP
jgi:hypothetical protein